ncbi:hypothetical protein [Streptomyces sp. NPDC017940]|uniref:hypothetical protein n=1 Tax=Streptomyces sp. NPDC017940 TaxID=3365017 RepID=UPI0037B18DCF
MHPAPTPALGGSRWNAFPAGGTVLTAARFLTATEPLLQGIIDDNALTSADGRVLEEQIHATLALGTRETSLPLLVGPDSAPAARELGAQAERIGQELASWSTAALERLLTDPAPLPAGPLVVRSRCYGHLLTPAATDLLMGRRGGPVTMQLYNEWLHQIVLLRDALLPFTNWQDVPLTVTPTGLRHTEPARDAFLTELLVRQIRHTRIVDFARHVVTGTSGPDGYGFAAAGGTALPAVLDRSPLTAPRHLLTWRPDQATDEPLTYAADDPVTYVAEEADYYTAPRTLVEHLPPTTAPAGPLTARRAPGPTTPDGARTAHIEVTDGTRTVHVDLGQALRGHRFAHRPDPAVGDATAYGAHAGDSLPEDSPRTADIWAALRAPGLVWTRAGEVTLDATGQDDLVALALLGRLYPENVTVRPAGPPVAVTRAAGGADGHSGPSRLVTVVDPPRAR